MPRPPVPTSNIENFVYPANFDPAMRLLEALSFELSLDGGVTWTQPTIAQMWFGAELPETFAQFIDLFSELSPQLSTAELQSLLPGAQGRWNAKRWDDEQNISRAHGKAYEIILERSEDKHSSGDYFIGALRDITAARHKVRIVDEQQSRLRALGGVSITDFNGQRILLTSMTEDYCPRAAQISFRVKERSRVKRFYGAHVESHIEYELLRRLIAFLPEMASITAEVSPDGSALLCLLPDVKVIDVESLSQALTAFPIATPGGPARISLDINVQLLAEAAALNRTQVKTMPQNKDNIKPIGEEHILDLLNQRSLSLALQPICHASSGEVHHYEALMRVDDPAKGPQSAWRYILAAEELGLVHLLDQRAMERAALLMLRYPDIHVALNISAGTIGNQDHQDNYLSQLDAYPALHTRLSFEMTETMALAQPDLAAQFSERLRARGCMLAIDDFGVGHTSFKTLMTTEARQIKLDGSLIMGIYRNEDKQNFVRLMVDFADTFDVKLVAERVETAQEKRLLSALGVDYLQGYFLGRPIAERQFKGHIGISAYQA